MKTMVKMNSKAKLSRMMSTLIIWMKNTASLEMTSTASLATALRSRNKNA